MANADEETGMAECPSCFRQTADEDYGNWTKRLRRGVYGVDRVNRLVPAVAID